MNHLVANKIRVIESFINQSISIDASQWSSDNQFIHWSYPIAVNLTDKNLSLDVTQMGILQNRRNVLGQISYLILSTRTGDRYYEVFLDQLQSLMETCQTLSDQMMDEAEKQRHTPLVFFGKHVARQEASGSVEQNPGNTENSETVFRTSRRDQKGL